MLEKSPLEWIEYTQSAADFAAKAHEGQKRWGGEPYYNHVAYVGQLVNVNYDTARRDFGEQWSKIDLRHSVIAAAYLHDVLEDCNVTADEIEQNFGVMVREIVECLTHRKDELYYDYIGRIMNCGAWAFPCRLIKTCDLTHNLQGLDHKKDKQAKYMFALHILNIRLNVEEI